jgi:hypothetical protein
MSVALNEDLRSLQIGTGMRLTLAASAARKVARRMAPSEFERNACLQVARLFQNAARGESFLRDPNASPSTASLSDFRTLSTVGCALTKWFREQPGPRDQSVTGFLAAQGNAVESLDAETSPAKADQLAHFLEFLAKSLNEHISSLTSFPLSRRFDRPYLR